MPLKDGISRPAQRAMGEPICVWYCCQLSRTARAYWDQAGVLRCAPDAGVCPASRAAAVLLCAQTWDGASEHSDAANAAKAALRRAKRNALRRGQPSKHLAGINPRMAHR